MGIMDGTDADFTEECRRREKLTVNHGLCEILEDVYDIEKSLTIEAKRLTKLREKIINLNREDKNGSKAG